MLLPSCDLSVWESATNTLPAIGPAAQADGAITILCVDDHPLFLEGIGTVISEQRDMRVVGTAATAAEAVRQFSALRPSVLLLDMRLPDASGLVALRTILGQFPQARVVMLTTYGGDFEIQQALGCGAFGYMLKNCDHEELVTVIRAVHSGRKHVPSEVAQTLARHLGTETLTEREIQVLSEVAEGTQNQDIARRLSISQDTVKSHLRHILDKLGAKDRAQALAIAIRRGIIRL
jgi:DNA-binding NarL/FixJ family response regulator